MSMRGTRGVMQRDRYWRRKNDSGGGQPPMRERDGGEQVIDGLDGGCPAISGFFQPVL